MDEEVTQHATEDPEEEKQDDPVVLAQCSKCQRLMMSDGTGKSGTAFCKHKYVSSMSVVDHSNDQLGTPRREREQSPTTSSVPSDVRQLTIDRTLQEAYAMHELQHNQFETQDFIERFQTDSSTLGTTFDNCKKLLEDEFEELQEALLQRKRGLIDLLNKEYDERAEKIDKTINLLKIHESNAVDCKDKCYNFIQTMQTRNELKERQTNVIDSCKKQIDSKPVIKEVPISLSFRFDKHKEILKSLQTYGELKSRSINSGREIQYTPAQSDIKPLQIGGYGHINNNNNNNNNRYNHSNSSFNNGSKQRGNINNINNNNYNNNYNPDEYSDTKGYNGERREDSKVTEDTNDNDSNMEMEDTAIEEVYNNNNNNNNIDNNNNNNNVRNANNIVLPIVKRGTVKCKEGILWFSPTIKNPNFENGAIDGIDQKEYESYENTNIFLQIEFAQSDIKKLDDAAFQNCSIRYKSCTKVPKPDPSGKIQIEIPGTHFNGGQFVHGRGRIVYLNNSNVISDSGGVFEKDIVKPTEWCAPKSAEFKPNQGHVCTYKDSSTYASNEQQPQEEDNSINIPPPSGLADDDFNNNNNGNIMGNNNNNNNNNNDNNVNNGPIRIEGKRIKLKIDLLLNGQNPQSKQFPFRDEFSYDLLLAKTQQRARVENGKFEFALKNDPKIQVNDNASFKKYCIETEPDPRGYNAHITAKQIG